VLGVHENTVRNWADEGILRDVKVPGTRFRRFLESEIMSLVGTRAMAVDRIALSHVYVSTACQHGLHGECREKCKFCGNSCQCPHHGEA
jgi:predicted site-specific integrase-resolvase